jgi:leucyl-tRNA synthetase
MSKSKKNVIDPNTMLDIYGADTTRLFCLFASPPEKDLEWSENGIEGSQRFINRVWRIVYDYMDIIQKAQAFTGPPDELEGQARDLYKKTHQTIRKVTNDIEDRFHFNTAISAVMELVNAMYALDRDEIRKSGAAVMRFVVENVILLLSPMVPHVCEELWKTLGHDSSILLAQWPTYREDALEKDELLIVIQVNGKLRSKFTVGTDASEEEIKKMALSDERIVKFIEGKPVRKVVVVKDKLVNIVV